MSVNSCFEMNFEGNVFQALFSGCDAFVFFVKFDPFQHVAF